MRVVATKDLLAGGGIFGSHVSPAHPLRACRVHMVRWHPARVRDTGHGSRHGAANKRTQRLVPATEWNITAM